MTLHRHLKARIVMYEHKHRRPPSVVAIAQMLSTMLYHKRFFPFYTFNVLAGIDDEGLGAVYHYDAIGSFERVPYTTSGSGSSLVMSVLCGRARHLYRRYDGDLSYHKGRCDYAKVRVE